MNKPKKSKVKKLDTATKGAKFGIQAITFDSGKFTERNAMKWLKDKGFKPIKKAHIAGSLLRYRLHEPNAYKKFITKKTSVGINFVIGIY